MGKLLNIDFGSKRAYGLDILRAIAIIVVVFSHGAPLLPTKLVSFQEYFLIDGVFLFFVLSGFLIGTILIKILDKKKATFKNLADFWTRRWFRTLPNYFLILTVLILIGFVFHGGVNGVNPIPYFFFLQNFASPHPQFYSEAWTLSVEEWFYLIVPCVVFILAGIFKIAPKKAIMTTVVAIIVSSIAIRLYRYSIDPVTSVSQWDILFRKQVITRLDSLMFGVLGAYIAYYHKSLWVKYKKKLFAIGIFLLLATHVLSLYIASGSHIAQIGYGVYLTVFSFTLTAFGIFLLLPLLSEYKSGKGKVFKAVTTVSISSYSIYLIHLSLIQPFVIALFGAELTRFESIVRYVFYWILTIICSILLYKYFEKPTTGLREKFVSKRVADATSNNK
ncbi:MAG: acyltransferase family protein [Candidatus Saccharimonadaceae bacterium]